MKKKIQVGLLLFITLVLLGAVGYLSYVLTSDTKEGSPTQIRKTKASSQTYHKLIALNTISPTQSTTNPRLSPTKPASITPSQSSTISPTTIPIRTTPTLAPTMPAVTPRLITPTQIPTAIPTSTPIPTPSIIEGLGDGMNGPEVTISPTSGLLAYRNPTISSAPSPTKTTVGVGGGNKTTQLVSPTATQGKGGAGISISPTKVATLPESGWMQTSLILFIVATSTIIFSLLF